MYTNHPAPEPLEEDISTHGSSSLGQSYAGTSPEIIAEDSNTSQLAMGSAVRNQFEMDELPDPQEFTTKPLAHQQTTMTTISQLPQSQLESAPLLPPFASQDHQTSSKPAPQEQQLDVSLLPKPSYSQHIMLSIWHWTWLKEYFAILVSIVLVVAIGVVLNHYNEQPVPELPLNININTAVAITATLMRAALVYVVVQVLGQVRWSWFSSPKPLYDLHHFDQGGQSLFGLWHLAVHICRTGLRSFGGIVAVIAAASLAISFAITPFVQQAVRTIPCETRLEAETARIPIAQYVPWPNGRHKAESGYSRDVPHTLRSAIISSVSNPVQDIPVIRPSCPTGNCTFPNYSSMGLCNVCTDISDLTIWERLLNNASKSNGVHLKISIPNGLNATWINSQNILDARNNREPPVGLSVSYLDPSFNDKALGNWPLNVSGVFQIDTLAFSDARCIKGSNGANICLPNIPVDDELGNRTTSVLAVSCKIYPCLRNYKAQVNFGVFTEKPQSSVYANLLSSSQTNEGEVARGLSFSAMRSPCTLSNGKTYTIANATDFSSEPDEKYINVILRSGTLGNSRQGGGGEVKMPPECIYHLDQENMEWIKRFFAGPMFGRDNRCRFGDGLLLKSAEMVACDRWWLAQLYQSRNVTIETISRAMDALAKATSDQFRVSGPWPDVEWSQEILPNNVTGTVTRTTICLSFAWEWLLLPAGIIGVTTVLLTLTIIQSHRHADSQPVWKGSVLPLVIYGLSDASPKGKDSDCNINRDDREGNVTEPRAMVPLHIVEETAKRTEVRFRWTQSGFEVVGEKK